MICCLQLRCCCQKGWVFRQRGFVCCNTLNLAAPITGNWVSLNANFCKFWLGWQWILQIFANHPISCDKVLKSDVVPLSFDLTILHTTAKCLFLNLLSFILVSSVYFLNFSVIFFLSVWLLLCTICCSPWKVSRTSAEINKTKQNYNIAGNWWLCLKIGQNGLGGRISDPSAGIRF